LLAALLRAFAMLVLCAASIFRMRPSRLPGECHADATPQTLPAKTSGKLETHTAAAHSQSQEALILSGPRSGRPVYPEPVEGSKDEGGLAAIFADRRWKRCNCCNRFFPRRLSTPLARPS
jgi:hypothetical protein